MPNINDINGYEPQSVNDVFNTKVLGILFTTYPLFHPFLEY